MVPPVAGIAIKSGISWQLLSLESSCGLADGWNWTLEEVGREFGVTRERIRQIEAKAARKLRHPGRSRKLRYFLVKCWSPLRVPTPETPAQSCHPEKRRRI